MSQTGCHDDATIVGANGILQFNSFVLAAMFPVLRGILETPVQYDDKAVLMIPDLAVDVLETFLQDLHQHRVVFGVSSDLECLMRPEGVFRIEDNSDSQSYSASDRDTVSGVNVDTDVKVEYQPFPCEYYLSTDHLGSKINESRMLKTICLWNYKNI